METRRATLLGAFSLVVLASEIALTRIFNAVFWYHFGFLILSTSLLGFALGGVAVRLLAKRLERRDPDATIGLAVAASGVLLAAALAVISHAYFDPERIHRGGAEMAKLLVAAAALVVPFTVMGGTVLYVIERGAADVGRLYASNLAGSGLGCLAAIVLLDAGGGRTAFLVLAAAAPLLAAWYAGRRRRAAAAGSLAAGLLILATIPFAESLFPMTNPGGKGQQVTCQDPSAIVFSDWTAVSKLDICRNDAFHATGAGLWGLSPANRAPLPDRLAAMIDSWAYTTILRHDDAPGYYDFYDALPLYLGYHLVDRPRALIIGPGGGMDIRGALRYGAREVDAVEINPALFRAMTEDLAAFSGNVYTLPGVTPHLGEGRSFVQSSGKRYDLIQLSGVDTLTATQAGAFALTESFLYTTEAFRSYLDHLEDDGVLTLTRWFLPDAAGRCRHSMRLFALAVAALEESGVARPGDHLLYVVSGSFTVLVVTKRPLGPADLAVADRQVLGKGFRYLYAPGRRPPADSPAFAFYDFLDAPERARWLAAYPYDVAPPTDDSPFFFEFRKLSDALSPRGLVTEKGIDGLGVLVLLFLEMLAACVALLLLSWRLQSHGTRPAGWLYFAAIGLGFMLVEVSLSQRLVLFLGHPTYALSVVLFSVLVFSGLGALLSERLARVAPPRVWLFGVAAAMLLWAALGNPVLRALVGLPVPLRILVAVAIIAPASVLMGIAFPEGVRRLTASGESDLGIYWAWNGVASVLATVLAVLVAMASGFGAVMVLAALAYVVAGLVLPRLGAAPVR